MPRNALLDETKEPQWSLPSDAHGWADKVRLQPTVVRILDDARPSTLGKGDQLIHGALKTALITAIVLDRWTWVYATLGEILGAHPPSGGTSPERGNDERKPLARATR